MQIDSSRGTFEEVMHNATPEAAVIAYRLRELIVSVYPDVTEVPRPAEQHVEYSVGPNRAAEIFGYLCPVKDYVRLGFYIWEYASRSQKEVSG